MGFSVEWEQNFASNQHLSVWPWSDLVSYVMRYARPVAGSFRVLEVGCGAGANIPFFLKLGVQYVGIDGSASTIERLKLEYPELAGSLHVMDFTKELPVGCFDLIVDRAAITHNSSENIIKTLSKIYSALNENGKFIGIDWFSTEYSDFKNKSLGQATTDEWTYAFGPESRAFANLGNVHFSNVEHIKELFSKFSLENIQHKVINELDSGSDWTFASFNFVAIK